MLTKTKLREPSITSPSQPVSHKSAFGINHNMYSNIMYSNNRHFFMRIILLPWKPNPRFDLFPQYTKGIVWHDNQIIEMPVSNISLTFWSKWHHKVFLVSRWRCVNWITYWFAVDINLVNMLWCIRIGPIQPYLCSTGHISGNDLAD